MLASLTVVIHKQASLLAAYLPIKTDIEQHCTNSKKKKITLNRNLHNIYSLSNSVNVQLCCNIARIYKCVMPLGYLQAISLVDVLVANPCLREFTVEPLLTDISRKHTPSHCPSHI